MMQTYNSVKAAVKALDGAEPGWFNHVEVAALRMNDALRCRVA
jgi:hypothetical protein